LAIFIFQVLYDLPTQTSITSLAVLVSVVFVAVVAVAVIVCGCHRRFPSFAIKAVLSFWVLCTDRPVARPSRGPVSRMRYDVTVHELKATCPVTSSTLPRPAAMLISSHKHRVD